MSDIIMKRVPKKFRRSDWRYRVALTFAESGWSVMGTIEKLVDSLRAMGDESAAVEAEKLHRFVSPWCGFDYLYQSDVSSALFRGMEVALSSRSPKSKVKARASKSPKRGQVEEAA
jgi:hypothetical protein